VIDEGGPQPAVPSPVSTGRLPPSERVQPLVDAAYARFRTNDDGANAIDYPALAAVRRDLFGICVAGVDGELYAVGDAEHPFTITSVAKPFVLALVCEALGADVVRERVGVNSTGMPFDSLIAFELKADRLTNPMASAGALATTSLVPGATADARWRFILDGLSRFAGRSLALNAGVYASASATSQRHRGIAHLLESRGRLYADPIATTDLYTRQSCVDVTARDLAVMSATLADGGMNPVTRERVVDLGVCQPVLAVMATAGLYEASGDWLYAIGLPGKGGVGGGIITVAPGKGGVCAFAPPLDAAGNSVRGQLAARFLAERLGLSLFISKPAGA